MQNDSLQLFCNNNSRSSFKIIPDPYWTTRVYSFGKYLKEYGYYPSWLPLCVYSDHGISCVNKPYKHELEADAPTRLCHSPRSKIEWEKYSRKPCHVMFSPYVFYRRKNKIIPSANRQGTIAFPAHTTPSIDDISDIEQYINHLIDLPKEFQPVSICLHMHDINKGRHHIFKKYKMQVYTAGNVLDDRFAERFYEIIKNFKYATSNMVGSYLYYCVEMGIPFSIYGNKQLFINKLDPNIPKGFYDPYYEFQEYRFVYDMFSGLFTEITEEQMKFVELSLGVKDGISRKKMSLILYMSLFKWIFSGTCVKYFHLFIKKILNEYKEKF